MGKHTMESSFAKINNISLFEGGNITIKEFDDAASAKLAKLTLSQDVNLDTVVTDLEVAKSTIAGSPTTVDNIKVLIKKQAFIHSIINS